MKENIKMKKRKPILVLILIVLCVVGLGIVFSDKIPEIFPNGAGGSDIATENSEQSSNSNKTTEKITTTSRYTKDDNLIALTFDDGPSNIHTNKILDLLEKYKGAATFFIVGYNIEHTVPTIKRALELGCEIGNHSNDHKNLTKCSYDTLRYQVDTPNKLIKKYTGVSPTLFRAPGGNFKDVEEDIGMPLIQWSIDTKDWKYKDAANKDRTEKEREADLKKIADDVVNRAEKGDIILMHDIYDFTVDLCEIIIPALTEKGFKLVTVSEMYNAYGAELKAGKVYYNIDVLPADVKALEPGNYKVKTNGGVLNVRIDTNVQSESLAKIPNGTAITVLKSVPGWAYVKYDGAEGWVNAKFLVKA